MTTGEPDAGRRVLAIGGADRLAFLQGLVSNDTAKLAEGPVYAALLTPQGKYLADFLLVPGPDGVIWLDVDARLAPDLLRRLQMYRLRADVTIAETALVVRRGLGTPPDGAVVDPRHPALGWRRYGHADIDAPADAAPAIDWAAIRVQHTIPETLVELVPDDSYILEMGFERLNGVDFRKGCYVGQEVTARMKHKTELRKGLVVVAVDGPAVPGTEITTADGRAAGRLGTRAGDRAIAYLRFDRLAAGGLQAGAARVTPLAP